MTPSEYRNKLKAEIDALTAEIAGLTAKSAELKSQLGILQEMQKQELDRSTVERLARIFGSENGAAPPVSTPKQREQRHRKSPIFEAISELFSSHKNKWATPAEIVKTTKLKETQVKTCLYETRRDAFERRSNPGHPSQFRLKKK